MVALLVTCAVVVLAAAAELLHARRSRKVAALAFGPRQAPAPWVYGAAPLRIAALASLTWGLVTLFELVPKPRLVGVLPEKEYRNLLLVLDVSPSMRLEDAGPTGNQSRRRRAADLLQSFFERIPVDHYRLTVMATYTEAKPVVVATTDMEVVRNILNDLPMQYAFKTGPTNLFAGLEEAAKIARSWRVKSTILMVVSDGDTIPATGLPKMPEAIDKVVVIGVGDVVSGKSIAGHQSRQDASTLRQLAVRLGGNYHDGNQKQLPTSLVTSLTARPGQSAFERLTRREYALLAIAAGATVLALLPLLLHYFGTFYVPGVPVRPRGSAARPSGENRFTVRNPMEHGLASTKEVAR
jgi:Ca-activated chloride channel family protein